MSDVSCWGCAAEPAVGGTLGVRCRQQLAERRTDPSTPRLNAMVERLAGIYAQLCWNCEVELAEGISGLCSACEAELRR